MSGLARRVSAGFHGLARTFAKLSGIAGTFTTGSGVAGILASVSGIVGMFALWELAGRSGLLGPSWPPFSRVAVYLFAPAHRALLLGAAGQTLGEAALGFAIGAAAGFACALLGVLIPPAAYGLDRFAALVNGIPVIAIGSLCAVTFPPAVNPIVVASLAVFFMLFVAASAGFNATPAPQRDLLRVLGASRWETFRRLQLPAALPAIADGLQLSAPVSVVGAIIGEWFAAENGLGPVLVNAMQNYQIDLLWSAALVGALMSATAYFSLGSLGRAAARRYLAR